MISRNQSAMRNRETSVYGTLNAKRSVFRVCLVVMCSIATMSRADISFDNNIPFHGLPLPHCPEDIQPTMRVYTRSDKDSGQIITRLMIPSTFNGQKMTSFLVHGFWNSENTTWLHTMKDVILKQEDYNVIIVGWGRFGSGLDTVDYCQSVSDTRSIGYEIALVASRLISVANSSASLLHCIGHSLGAHVCGHAGMRTKFGRITGLDPAGPEFDSRNLTAGLNPSCADFVDVIHTNGKGYGLMNTVGHVDFYPNGGGNQPSCGMLQTGEIACSHHRAIDYFIESIASTCFRSTHKCNTHEKLPCSCSSTDSVQYMGFNADFKARGIFYLTTAGNEPFCNTANSSWVAHASCSAHHGSINTHAVVDVVCSAANAFSSPRSVVCQTASRPDEQAHNTACRPLGISSKLFAWLLVLLDAV